MNVYKLLQFTFIATCFEFFSLALFNWISLHTLLQRNPSEQKNANIPDCYCNNVTWDTPCPPDVLAPTPCPTLSRMKGCCESVRKKFTWRKNKHRVECGGDDRALHGPMQIDRDTSGHILRRWGEQEQDIDCCHIPDIWWYGGEQSWDNFTRSSSFLSSLGRAARLV